MGKMCFSSLEPRNLLHHVNLWAFFWKIMEKKYFQYLIDSFLRDLHECNISTSLIISWTIMMAFNQMEKKILHSKSVATFVCPIVLSLKYYCCDDTFWHLTIWQLQRPNPVGTTTRLIRPMFAQVWTEVAFPRPIPRRGIRKTTTTAARSGRKGRKCSKGGCWKGKGKEV